MCVWGGGVVVVSMNGAGEWVLIVPIFAVKFIFDPVFTTGGGGTGGRARERVSVCARIYGLSFTL